MLRDLEGTGASALTAVRVLPEPVHSSADRQMSAAGDRKSARGPAIAGRRESELARGAHGVLREVGRLRPGTRFVLGEEDGVVLDPVGELIAVNVEGRTEFWPPRIVVEVVR